MLRNLKTQVLDADAVLVGDAAEISSLWETSRGEAFAPEYGPKFNLELLSVAVIPSVSIVDVLDGGRDYFYRFWGTKNTETKGFEMTGKLLSEGEFPDVTRLGREQFGQILESRRPLVFAYGGPYNKYTFNKQITYRWPLSSDGVTIDKIISYQNLSADKNGWVEAFDEVWRSLHPERERPVK